MKLTNNIFYAVHDILATSPECRNSDQKLICMVWAKLHPHRIFTATEQPVKCFAVRDIMDLFESTETIRRSRQIIQNDLGLYPPSETVKNGRRKNQEIIEEWKRNKFTPEQTKFILTAYLKCKNKSTFELKKIIQELQ